MLTQETIKKEADKKSMPSYIPAIADSFQIYINQVSQIPPLKPKEEMELAIKYKEEGNLKAAYRIVIGHRRLVIKIAMEYQHKWRANLIDDLVQEVNIAVIQAELNGR